MTPSAQTSPARWLIDHADLLPHDGRALDLACGVGRHALWLAGRGLHTTALDASPSVIVELRTSSSARGLEIDAQVRDLEDGSFALPVRAYDVIVVVNYLHRPLVPSLLRALRPGGVLVYETFLREQARRGKPTNPNFLLEPGELVRLVNGLDVLAYREGEFEDKMLASVVARRPAGLDTVDG